MEKDILIELKDVSKHYGKTKVIENINLYVKKNEFLTLLGPSGCGKTTILRMIGGFEKPTTGDVIFDEEIINDMPVHKRPLNTIFQKYALFPHMNVFDNIAFGLKISKAPKTEIKEKVTKMLELVKLEGYEKRKANSLSGGQQQRVAIARALVNEPKVLLLDEPLGALDLKLRQEMQIELKEMQERLGITFIFVTHDQEEALTMSDTIVVLDKGDIQQIGTPEEIYNRPRNCFVAKFIGESNIVSANMIENNLVEISNAKFKCVESRFSPGQEVNVIIRPEDIKIVSRGQGTIEGVVELVTFKGVYYEMIIRENDRVWKVQNINKREVNEIVGMTVESERIHVIRKADSEKIIK